MSEQVVRPERKEFEQPPYGFSFVLQMVLLALATLGIQIGLIGFVAKNPWSIGRGMPQIAGRSFGIRGATTVLPGNSTVWDGELWVSVVPTMPATPGRNPARATSSHLMAFDLETGLPQETDLTLSPSPVGLLVVGDQLWVVSENVVDRIQNDRAIHSYPRRQLNQPTKPFVYDGRLAVIDKNRNDVYSLLTWDEGEWTEISQIDVPKSPAVARITPELRVLSDGASTYLFFFDVLTIRYREGMGLDFASDSVSALQPANSPIVNDELSSNGVAASALPSGWKKFPTVANFSQVWDVAIVNHELCVFVRSPSGRSSTLQQFKKVGQDWVTTTLQNRFEASSFSVAGGSTGYISTDDLQLFSVDNINGFQQITASVQSSERMQIALLMFIVFGPYLVATAVLCAGSSWLMRIHRTPQYFFGKRTVILASLDRRGVARGIDSLASVFPAAFWFFAAATAESDVQQKSGELGLHNLFLLLLFSIFGMWLGTILVLSYMEGRWGITPGKWLCGIRTLRTTLRPCGMLRALTRELLVYADSVFLVTWLPGVLLIAFTKHWQRLGDLTADTVVVIVPKA